MSSSGGGMGPCASEGGIMSSSGGGIGPCANDGGIMSSSGGGIGPCQNIAKTSAVQIVAHTALNRRLLFIFLSFCQELLPGA